MVRYPVRDRPRWIAPAAASSPVPATRRPSRCDRLSRRGGCWEVRPWLSSPVLPVHRRAAAAGRLGPPAARRNQYPEPPPPPEDETAAPDTVTSCQTPPDALTPLPLAWPGAVSAT